MSHRATCLIVPLFTVLLGCNAGTQSSTSSSPADEVPSAESTAKELLTKALDAWALGDSEQELEKRQSEFYFSEVDMRLKLLRYEIGPSRARGMDDGRLIECEFAVTVVFQTEGGQEFKKAKVYAVLPPLDKAMARFDRWRIAARL